MHFVLERAQLRPELKPAPRLIGLKMILSNLQGQSDGTSFSKTPSTI